MSIPAPEFCDPLRVFAPNEKAAKFILCSLRISKTAMIEWLAKKDEADPNNEFVRLDIRVNDPNRTFEWPTWEPATPFAVVNSWKPTPKPEETPPSPADAF